MTTSPHTLSSFVAVRIQDEMHGLYTDENGVHLPYLSDRHARNTMHFSLNGTVGDHAYGTFNENPDGSLKGKVVILAKLDELPIPSGFNQVDTWFRLSAQEDASGTIQRSLPVGNASVVVPKGTAVPEGVNVIYYEGTIEARDAAVKQYFLDAGIQQQSISGLRAWDGVHENDAKEWARQTATELYGKQASKIHCDMHDCSVDSTLERAGVNGYVASLGKRRLTQAAEGWDVLLIDEIRQKGKSSSERIQHFLDSQPLDIERSRPFYEAQLKELDVQLAYAEELDRQWAAKEHNQFIESIRTDLESLQGQGPFYVLRPGTTEHDKITTEDLATMLANGDLIKTQQIWRHGMHDEWRPIQNSAIARLEGARWFNYQKDTPPQQDRSLAELILDGNDSEAIQQGIAAYKAQQTEPSSMGITSDSFEL